MEKRKSKIYNRLVLLSIRVHVAWKVLTNPSMSFFIVFVPTDTIKSQITGGDIDLQVTRHRLQDFNVRSACSSMSEGFDHYKELQAIKDKLNE